MGLTWLFGFILLFTRNETVAIAVAWLFALFSSLQVKIQQCFFKSFGISMSQQPGVLTTLLYSYIIKVQGDPKKMTPLAMHISPKIMTRNQ